MSEDFLSPRKISPRTIDVRGTMYPRMICPPPGWIVPLKKVSGVSFVLIATLSCVLKIIFIVLVIVNSCKLCVKHRCWYRWLRDQAGGWGPLSFGTTGYSPGSYACPPPPPPPPPPPHVAGRLLTLYVCMQCLLSLSPDKVRRGGGGSRMV